MAAMKYGYRGGTRPRTLIPVPVLAAATWEAGDFLIKDSNGFYAKAADADVIHAVAFDAVTTAPTTSGDFSVLADISLDSIYRIPVNQGTLAITMLQKTCDLGVTSGVQGADVDLSTDDCLLIVGVDIAANEVDVQIRPPVTGVA